jgi:putative hydrolase of the HAD superfamily
MRGLPELGRVDAVLCDAGGVLLLPDPEMLRSLLQPHGLVPSDEDVVRAHFVAVRALDEAGYTAYTVGHRAFARSIGARSDQIATAATAIADIYVRHPHVPASGAARSLRRLAAAGVVLGVVSNASGTMARQLADHRICSTDGAGAEVAVVVDSEVVGVAKPDPAIFQIALDAIDVSPDRCWYIGDSLYFDVQGARSAGLPCAHVDPYGYCQADDHPHVASLSQFADALLLGR